RAIEHLESIADRFQNLLDLRRRQQRRSAATQIDGIDSALLFNSTPGGDLAPDCVNVSRSQFAFVHARRKVAVRATRTTEGNVYVDSCACHEFEIIDAGVTHRLTRGFLPSRFSIFFSLRLCVKINSEFPAKPQRTKDVRRKAVLLLCTL